MPPGVTKSFAYYATTTRSLASAPKAPPFVASLAASATRLALSSFSRSLCRLFLISRFIYVNVSHYCSYLQNPGALGSLTTTTSLSHQPMQQFLCTSVLSFDLIIPSSALSPLIFAFVNSPLSPPSLLGGPLPRIV